MLRIAITFTDELNKKYGGSVMSVIMRALLNF